MLFGVTVLLYFSILSVVLKQIYFEVSGYYNYFVLFVNILEKVFKKVNAVTIGVWSVVPRQKNYWFRIRLSYFDTHRLYVVSTNADLFS